METIKILIANNPEMFINQTTRELKSLHMLQKISFSKNNKIKNIRIQSTVILKLKNKKQT